MAKVKQASALQEKKSPLKKKKMRKGQWR